MPADVPFAAVSGVLVAVGSGVLLGVADTGGVGVGVGVIGEHATVLE